MASQPLKVRWKARRNRMFASRAFQHWTARLPFSRSIARDRAGSMFDHIVGFSYSRVLLAVVESDLLSMLKGGPIASAYVANKADLSNDAALCLLRAARALDVAEEVLPDQWMLGQQGAVLEANAGAQAMIRHHRLLYRDLVEPLELLRKDRKQASELSTYWSYAGALQGTAERGEDTTEYSELMAASQHFVADEVLASFDFARQGKLLDVGGGHGAFLKRVGEAYPTLQLGLFDLPEVVEAGRAALADAVGEDRLSCHPGNFFEEAIPSGYDLVSLVRILHDHDDSPAQKLLHNIRRSLAPGGRLMIAEPMARIAGAEPMGEAFFGLYLWAMGSGRARSPKEIQSMLKEAGFSRTRFIPGPQPVVASIVVAQA